MTPQELKNSILQLAIQGKLVEQRPEEGTAQELYAQIQAEKQRLIKEGKLKKEKPLPEITEEEKPFEIPEGWMWVRIGQIFNLQAGKNITSTHIFDDQSLDHFYLCYGGNGIRGYVSSFNREGCFALIGRQGALCGNINFAQGQFYATEHAVVVDHFNQSDVTWGGWFLRALNLNQYATATAQPGLAVSTIVKVLIPLPPLAEQKRIVAKIQELLPLVDRYEEAWTKLEDFNRRFPEDMKKSILQQAIQGKLVEQRPEEGTAQELYAQIQAEKQRLIKEGKLKKEKPLPEITEDEKPFEIPEGWMWVHLNYIASSSLGKTLDKAKNTGELQPYLCSINVYWNGISLEKVKEARFEEAELPKYLLEKGDLLICEGGEVGRCAVWEQDITMYYQNALHRVRFYQGINPYFYKYLVECYKRIGIIDRFSKGVTIKHLVQNSLNAMWVPLPPLAEQKRIVARLEELLPLCEELSNGII